MKKILYYIFIKPIRWIFWDNYFTQLSINNWKNIYKYFKNDR
jgi:hypothetical protein